MKRLAPKKPAIKNTAIRNVMNRVLKWGDEDGIGDLRRSVKNGRDGAQAAIALLYIEIKKQYEDVRNIQSQLIKTLLKEAVNGDPDALAELKVTARQKSLDGSEASLALQYGKALKEWRRTHGK